MKRSSGKKKADAVTPDDSTKPARKPPPGMPAPDSVVSEKVFKSPKGKVYRILKTTERDAYDEPARPKGRPKTGR